MIVACFCQFQSETDVFHVNKEMCEQLRIETNVWVRI